MEEINNLSQSNLLFQKILEGEILENDLTIEDKISILIEKVNHLNNFDRILNLRIIDRCFELLKKLESKSTFHHVVVYSEYYHLYEDDIIERQNKAVLFLKKAHRIISSLFPDFPYKMSAEDLMKIPFIQMHRILSFFERYNHNCQAENEYFFGKNRQNPRRRKNSIFVKNYSNFMIKRCQEVLGFFSETQSEDLMVKKYIIFSSHLYHSYGHISRIMKFEGKFQQSIKYLDMAFQVKIRELEVHKAAVAKKIEQRVCNLRLPISFLPIDQNVLITMANGQLDSQFHICKCRYLGEKIKVLIHDLGVLDNVPNLLNEMKETISQMSDGNQKDVNVCFYWRILCGFYRSVGNVEKMEKSLDKTIELNVRLYGIDHRFVIDYLIMRIQHNLSRNRFNMVRVDLKRVSKCKLDQRHTKWFNEETENLQKAESEFFKKNKNNEKRSRRRRRRMKNEKHWKKLFKKCSNSVCENVESKSVKFKVCGGCKVRSYCCIKCQRNDWKKGHKKNCSKSFIS